MSRHERNARAGVQWVGGERPGVHLLWRDRVLREGRRHELPFGDALVPAGGVNLGESVAESRSCARTATRAGRLERLLLLQQRRAAAPPALLCHHCGGRGHALQQSLCLMPNERETVGHLYVAARQMMCVTPAPPSDTGERRRRLHSPG